MNETTKTISRQMFIDNALIGAGLFNKATRKANVTAILQDRSKYKGLSVDGSLLKVDITLGFSADTEFHNKLNEVVNAHVSTVEKTNQGTGKTFLVVDLLKLR